VARRLAGRQRGEVLVLARPTFEKTLDAPLKCRAWQKHSALAGHTLDADLGAKSHDPPCIAATRVWFAHLDDIAEVKIERWGRHIQLLALTILSRSNTCQLTRMRIDCHKASKPQRHREGVESSCLRVFAAI
jgi:hypothetical protein